MRPLLGTNKKIGLNTSQEQHKLTKNKKILREDENPLKPHKISGMDLEKENNQGKVLKGEAKIMEINQPWVGGTPNLATKGKTERKG